jgi:hypothetical protein
MFGVFDDNGIRFEYPPAWEIDVSEDGPRTSVTVQSPSGLAFAMVTIDDTFPASETIDGHNAIGHDIEFLSLDMTNSCVIRCFSTPRRTVFVLTQWSDLEEDEPEHALAALRRSLEETDS